MKVSTPVVALATASVALAQSAGDLPSCSIPCFIQYVPQTGCSLTDYACQCTTAHQNQIKGEITKCVTSKCTTQSDQLKTLQVTTAICAKYASGGSSGSMSGSMSGSASSMMSGSSMASSMMSGSSMMSSSMSAATGINMGSAAAANGGSAATMTGTATSSESAAFSPTGPPTSEFTGAKAALDLDARDALKKVGLVAAGLGAVGAWAL